MSRHLERALVLALTIIRAWHLRPVRATRKAHQ